EERVPVREGLGVQHAGRRGRPGRGLVRGLGHDLEAVSAERVAPSFGDGDLVREDEDVRSHGRGAPRGASRTYTTGLVMLKARRQTHAGSIDTRLPRCYQRPPLGPEGPRRPEMFKSTCVFSGSSNRKLAEA